MALGYKAYGDEEHSEKHARSIDATRRYFATGLEALQDLDRSFEHCRNDDIGLCDDCDIGGWRKSIQMSVDGIQEFSIFL